MITVLAWYLLVINAIMSFITFDKYDSTRAALLVNLVYLVPQIFLSMLVIL